jgi:hypothetical protein
MTPAFFPAGDLEARFEANLEVSRLALEAAMAEPWVPGSKGQPVAHPGFAVAAKADDVALRLATELRMCQRQFPQEAPTTFDELDGTLDDLLARRRFRESGEPGGGVGGYPRRYLP